MYGTVVPNKACIKEQQVVIKVNLMKFNNIFQSITLLLKGQI